MSYSLYSVGVSERAPGPGVGAAERGADPAGNDRHTARGERLLGQNTAQRTESGGRVCAGHGQGVDSKVCGCVFVGAEWLRMHLCV